MSEKYSMTIDVLAKRIDSMIEERCSKRSPYYGGRSVSSLDWNFDLGRFILPSENKMKGALAKLRSGYSLLKMEIIAVNYQNPSECRIEVQFEKHKNEKLDKAEARVTATFAELFQPYVEKPTCDYMRHDTSEVYYDCCCE